MITPALFFFPQDYFGYSGVFMVLYKFQDYLFQSSEKCRECFVVFCFFFFFCFFAFFLGVFFVFCGFQTWWFVGGVVGVCLGFNCSYLPCTAGRRWATLPFYVYMCICTYFLSMYLLFIQYQLIDLILFMSLIYLLSLYLSI